METRSMTQDLAAAIVATAYNLHVRTGAAMTPAAARKLSRGDQAALCRLLENRGGSTLYSREDAARAFAYIVG